ncbi:MAG: ATP-binding cassette domain-containing protein [Alphaproteobacteria bacterium]|jgi:ABC transport system ATP-binding/permease protein|nr:ATP-binding cassette domain-containing protein [Alphaproteobacteria bacterium]MBT4017389.1 ATP-binding cassette domain-containing protein [Alphaproteobacteria bacterium]MBT4965902.1 ATP-binding cassette domain-containing protein [Alphaproteobacteria bacterium]MBT5159354.1 ATP-binding cassette domain-containing protein [Alphaproteobacteria bacterium]MBT5920081.1 ATP-binding cassette domain-containing protein [Alphaproteobacteria bacterium]
MAPPVLHLRDIELSFGTTPLLEGAEMAVMSGDRLCLVGRNGSGKSTLLKIAAGLIDIDGGERFVQPGTTVRYLAQEPDLSNFETTLAYAESGLTAGDDPWRAQYLLQQLGLTGEEDPKVLSGGEARRCALAQAMAPEPDILLLDEPTNHLDLPAIEWLESELKGLRSALVMISHDRSFLNALSTATIWLDRGVARRMDRGFPHFENWRDEVLEQEQLERHKLDRKIVREEHWITYGVTARRKRNQGRLRELATLRQTRKDQRQATGNVKITVTEGETSGKRVAEAKNISKIWDGPPVVSDLSLRIQRGDRLGIVGPNGAGKTTLLKMLTGELEPDSGSVKLGTTLQMVSLDQRRDSLKPDWSLQDALTGGVGDLVEVNGQSRHVMSYMKDFLFAPEQARTVVSALSGGERGRLLLAMALAKPSNLLILDEPTNDLDLETLDLLQEMLANYPGTALIVSHDRDFLDRVATSILVFEGDGRWIEYAGGYNDMLAQRKASVTSNVEAGQKTRQSKAGAAKNKSASRMTFKDKHALETLPDQMAKIQVDIKDFQATLADPDMFARNPDKFNGAVKSLEKSQVKLASCEERWLELEMMREEIEAG